MIYLNEADIREIGISWDSLIDIIEEAATCLGSGDFAQPIKPYLRYRDLTNRIIAMPAFVGGHVDLAGIKWIASFPGNIDRGIPRAHSVVILNKADSGEPVAIVNTPLLSILRTAAVSGLIIRYFHRLRPLRNIKLGMTGWGPIGRCHLKMCAALLGQDISQVSIYDPKGVDTDFVDFMDPGKIQAANHWQQAYRDADLFITCTVSKAPYIDQPPKPGSLQLNVSLRDYTTAVYPYVKDSIIVDDWQEVCREKTDIEIMHQKKGLSKADTRSIVDLVQHNCIKDYSPELPVMFNPMGMAVFDVAVAGHYFKEARGKNLGTRL